MPLALCVFFLRPDTTDREILRALDDVVLNIAK